ncbi:amidohydrolase [Tenuifilum thalassicum]|nr:amidohydrolase [Tenuifilum thalassicum]
MSTKRWLTLAKKIGDKGMQIAVIQSDLHWENSTRNFEQFESILAEIKNGTHLVLLPEMFTTGFSMNPEKLAEKYPGKTVEWMVLQAKKHGFAIVGSHIAEHQGKFYNRMVFAHPTGKIDIYDKRHLFRMANEDKHYTAGENRVVVEYLGWRIMLAVCYDLRFPVWLRNQNDYDLMLLVANFPERRRYAWNSLLVARAIENQAYIAACNRVGTDGNGFNHTGDSQILDPMGQLIALAKPNRKEIIYADIDLEHLNRIREGFPVHLDADRFKIID